MVRCCKALSNPPLSCYNLRKVKIHVRRLRSGNSGSCAGEQHPQLESPGPAGSAGGTPNRRARFRLQFPQLALRRRLGQLSCMSRPALKLRSWPLTILYYLLPFGALKPLTRVGWRPMSR
ncbi:unnamed protein product, partial [Natator depressus]